MNPGAPNESGLARLRHDLRTPINHILGYGELVAEELADEGVTSVGDDLTKIRDAANRLLAMIGEHLSDEGFARLVAGAAQESPAPAHRHEPRDDAPAPRTFQYQELTPHVREGAAVALTGRILVVDDDADNRETLARRLERQGHATATAADGAEALEIARREPFDLVLLDVLMPVLDGYGALAALKANEDLRHIPVIMISALDELDSVVRCIEQGAEDYLPKPFNATLLRARIGASLEKKRLRDQEQEHLRTIQQTQNRLSAELREAANYVRSIIPEPLAEPYPIDWRYIPSTELGGDAFGYHWIDGDHFAIYLLDVCGHGVGASLLSVTAINVIRSGSLAKTDFRDPAQVLAGLNDAFPMERQNNMYFTIWYGVYHRPSRTLRHASGGHPPAFLLAPGGGAFALTELRCPGALIGVIEGMDYACEACAVPAGSRLIIFCDGAYELRRADGTMIAYEEFVDFMAAHGADAGALDELIAWVHAIQGDGPLDDDFSILRAQF